MDIEIEDNEFNDLLAEKRHKELSGSLKKIAMLLSEPAKEDRSFDIIKSNVDALRNVVSIIGKQKEVSVTVNNSELLPLLKAIKEGNDKILTALNSKPIVDGFKVKNTDRHTKTIEVMYKKATNGR